MDNILVSIVIPTYNREDFILKTIKNVLNQTYPHIEVIVIDDGSTDNTKILIEEFIKQNNIDNVRYYWKENGGVSSARNMGIDECKGKYIAFQDSDDLWKNDKIEKQLKKIISNDCNICYCGTIKKTNSTEKRLKNKFKEKKLLLSILKAESDAQTITWLIERDFIKDNKIKFNEECKYSEDLEFFMKCIYLGKVCCVKEYLAYYVDNQNSLSHNILSQMQELDMWDRFKSWMKINHNKSDYKMEKIEYLIDRYRMSSRLVFILYHLIGYDDEKFEEIYDAYNNILFKFNPMLGRYKKTFIFYYIKILIHKRVKKNSI